MQGRFPGHGTQLDTGEMGESATMESAAVGGGYSRIGFSLSGLGFHQREIRQAEACPTKPGAVWPTPRARVEWTERE
jgi:hypothetical protein